MWRSGRQELLANHITYPSCEFDRVDVLKVKNRSQDTLVCFRDDKVIVELETELQDCRDRFQNFVEPLELFSDAKSESRAMFVISAEPGDMIIRDVDHDLESFHMREISVEALWKLVARSRQTFKRNIPDYFNEEGCSAVHKLGSLIVYAFRGSK
ncbi:MAG: hypothetical protein Q9172_005401 [Xanthocarpia lactea]